VAFIDVEFFYLNNSKVDGLKQFNKEKKKIKKWARPYDTLIASEPLMKMIPRLLGNVLVKIGKFPISISEGEKVDAKVEEVRSTVRFQLKKVIYFMITLF